VGVTEPSGQLELAGDERIQEYPPRGFDGRNGLGESPTTYFVNGPNEVYIEGHGHFKSWSTNYYGGDYFSGGAFNKKWGPATDNRDRWVSLDNTFSAGTSSATVTVEGDPQTGLPLSTAPTFAGYKGAHLILELPYAINLKSFIIGAAANGESSYSVHASQTPSVFVIIASNDGNNWDTIFSHTATDGVATDYIDNVFSVNVTKAYSQYGYVALKNGNTSPWQHVTVGEWRLFGTPGPTTLDKGSLTLGRSLDVPRISRYDVDTETPRPEKLLVDFDTTVNSSPTDISGRGNHGRFYNGGLYSAADKAFKTTNGGGNVRGSHGLSGTQPVHSHSVWFKQTTDISDYTWVCAAGTADSQRQSGVLLSGNSSYPNRITFDNYGGWVTSTVTAELNRWYHVVATFNGGTTFNTTNCRIYVDGVDCTGPSSEVYNEQTFNLQGAVLALGSTNTGTRGLTGLISNYKLYDVVLEPSEVKKLYNLGRTGRSMVISDTAVGIGKAPEAQLDVRGIIKGQSPAVFIAKANAAMTATAASAIALFGTVITDTAGGWDSVNHRYYAKVPGFYIVNASQFTIVTTNVYVVIRIDKNGVEYSSTTGFAGPGGFPNTSLMALIYLSVGDYVRCRIGTDTNRTTASGHRLEIVHVGM
jgi:hypothetical protein